MWQVDALGDPTHEEGGFKARQLPVLLETLLEHYGAKHEVILYRAPVFPTSGPEIRRVRLGRVRRADVGGVTLYVPPRDRPVPDADVLQRRGFDPKRWYRPGAGRRATRPTERAHHP